jgi:hypothetical protein
MNKPTIPLPRGWTKTVRAAVLHVIALAQHSLALSFFTGKLSLDRYT